MRTSGGRASCSRPARSTTAFRAGHAPHPCASRNHDRLRWPAPRSASASPLVGHISPRAGPLQPRRETVPLAEAVHKMTGMPAQRFRHRAARADTAGILCRPGSVRSREDRSILQHSPILIGPRRAFMASGSTECSRTLRKEPREIALAASCREPSKRRHSKQLSA